MFQSGHFQYEDVRVFHTGIKDTIHKAGRTGVSWQHARNLTLQEERVSRTICSERKSAVESIGHFVRRIIFGVHCDRKIDELIVRFVLDREPNGLNVIFR